MARAPRENEQGAAAQRKEDMMLIITKRLRYKPGTTCRQSGQYTDSSGDQITMVKGNIFPPTKRPNMTWKLSDVSRGNR